MTRHALGHPSDRFDAVARIAVLRGGGIGDLVGALPALAALRGAYPEASITLLGMPSHAALLDGRPGSPVDETVVLPAHRGVRDGEPDPDAVEAFLAAMRERRFDLAVQAHGGGRNSNPFLLRLGARYTVGTRTEDAVPLTRTLPYRYYQHEVQRWLEVAGLAGAAPVELEPRLEPSDAERSTGRALLGDRPAVVIHPSATDPRRRWPAARFGVVAAALAEHGVTVLVVGDASDVAVADEIVRAARTALPADHRERVRSVAGTIDLGALAGVLAEADVVLANDSGPRHVAQALGTPTVGLFWFGNAVNAAPFTRAHHRVLLGWTTRCPVCGADVTQVGWTAERCPHDPSFLTDIHPEAVLAEVRALLAGD
ncbi:MAG TPA: glycosyltransferase family 9 protein [Amnibacterium sp.]|uniref:glycosyltransferase family 9 protein n=1 Tax=Amnibacterium sp. TaxID=1872496 RepID=UPI002F95CDD5